MNEPHPTEDWTALDSLFVVIVLLILALCVVELIVNS
jgi:hypothetical protein